MSLKFVQNWSKISLPTSIFFENFSNIVNLYEVSQQTFYSYIFPKFLHNYFEILPQLILSKFSQLLQYFFLIFLKTVQNFLKFLTKYAQVLK